MLIGQEGINFTVSGSEPTIQKFKDLLSLQIQAPLSVFKDSWADKEPFPNFKLKIKDEIVTMGAPGLIPEIHDETHLSTDEWHKALHDPDVVVLDTRNDYEYDVGHFKNATHFGIEDFKHFPQALKNAQIDKSKKVLIYCTGGIRCEKAIVEMHSQGFEKVYQLKGGILKYIEEHPREGFEGECFVFDYRVAVDQDLKPSERYRLCAHCGQPGDLKIECAQCHSSAIICSPCQTQGHDTCSKNCDHHKRIGSKSKRPHRQELAKRRFDKI